MGHGGNSAHALQDVQHQSFGLQQALHLALYAHYNVARLHMGSVLNVDLHFHCGVKTMEHLFGYFHSGKDSLFLDKQLALAHFRFRNAAQGCVVTVTNVFGKRQVNEFLIQFFNA